MAAEFVFDDYILVLDGRVVEIFNRNVMESKRLHVAFMGIEVNLKGDAHHVRLGLRRKHDMIVGGERLKMSADDFTRFQEWAALCIAARDETTA